MEQIDYKEKYEQALERARQFFEKPYLEDSAGIVGYIFPELRESEYEKIRKALIEMVHDTTGDSLWVDYNIHKEDALAWLERRGQTFTKKDVDDAYLKGVCDAKKELEKQAQKPTIEMKSAEESLGIDSDTYNKIVDECIFGEQKPAWSEEDKRIIDNLISQLGNLYARKLIKEETKDKYVNWLKSLKGRVQPQSQWKPSDEQMNNK